MYVRNKVNNDSSRNAKKELLSGVPLSDKEINKLLSINTIHNLKEYITFIKFKYAMTKKASVHFKNITTEKKQILLETKDDLVNVLRENSEKNNKSPLSEFYILDIAEYIINDLYETNEPKRVEQEVYNEICASYRDDYYEYRDRQFDAAFENMHSNWANNKLTQNMDPQWKKEKWTIWVHYFSDILNTLRHKDDLLHTSILHLKTISNSCKEVYSSLKYSLIDTYKTPFLSEYNKFLQSSIDKWTAQTEKLAKQKNEKDKEAFKGLNQRQ
ncbi:hypothetical protein MKS88_000771 [Plasmodium brasilianum]|uniref:Plasmodium RESA N-terminal domain-containing protein n=2 Tax=Plasmodium (Plasmodium) TaxID=418103 RepID=A0A1A8VMI7_PLAMA|nr:hypothetical protein MKS88_000771 [Plasmodium brasilianum]SBS81838.1 conserved Plasmodium protein, unknown function [Plasmodium malariae]